MATYNQRTQLTLVEHDTGAGGVTFVYTVPAQATAQVIYADGGNGNGWTEAASPAAIPFWACLGPTASGFTAGVHFLVVAGDVGNAKLATVALTATSPDTVAGVQVLGPGCTLTLAGPNTRAVIIESLLVG